MLTAQSLEENMFIRGYFRVGSEKETMAIFFFSTFISAPTNPRDQGAGSRFGSLHCAVQDGVDTLVCVELTREQVANALLVYKTTWGAGRKKSPTTGLK